MVAGITLLLPFLHSFLQIQINKLRQRASVSEFVTGLRGKKRGMVCSLLIPPPLLSSLVSIATSNAVPNGADPESKKERERGQVFESGASKRADRKSKGECLGRRREGESTKLTTVVCLSAVWELSNQERKKEHTYERERGRIYLRTYQPSE